jgi:hypothetical protein
MKPTTDSTQPAPAAAAAPAFDPAVAVAVPPTRHEPTGRTFAFVQGEHLFSATRLFVATDAAAAKAAAPNSKL